MNFYLVADLYLTNRAIYQVYSVSVLCIFQSMQSMPAELLKLQHEPLFQRLASRFSVFSEHALIFERAAELWRSLVFQSVQMYFSCIDVGYNHFGLHVCITNVVIVLHFSP